MNIKQILGVLAGMSLMLVATTPVLSAGYGSNWLEVRVVDKQSGSSIGQAAVCLGTAAQPDQFGARRAAADGIVRFNDIPANTMVLTASKLGYQGKLQSVEPLSGNRVIELNLASGGGGPACTAVTSEKEPQTTDELAITEAHVVADSASSSGNKVFVKVSVSGVANQIRVSESSSFKDAVWQELKPQNRYTVSEGKGVKRIYVQVRRQIKASGASIEVLSPARVAAYRR
ncbi:hypothetical protein MNBD_GAMMA15-1350 [hydrothermal vent metagenome]|uniref:Carboxypeptidase regulatory-like domain-containing protein n=1 Tax=hydrothermal vent metagenome TaxID=652676 RepID=A0A3B0Z0Y6_9ZZZZ